MPYQVNDCVVHPAHGVGRVVALAFQRFFDAQARLYYEIAIQRSTVWVPVDTDVASGLRPVTPKAELAHCRAILRGQPSPLTSDARQRNQELMERLKAGVFRDACEVVRDLSAHRWLKSLNETDARTLRRTQEGLCLEWAAANEVSVLEATQEVEALLGEGRQLYQTKAK